MPFFFFSFLFVLVVCLAWGVVGSYRVVRQVRYCPPLVPEDFGLPFDEVQLNAADGLPLAGWLIRNSNPAGVLLMLHGYGACKADLLDVAKAFHENGSYHLLLIDFRAHGASGGKRISFGKQEVMDVQAAINFLRSSAQLRSFPVGCYGVSMGGAIGLLAASRLKQIQAIVADSSYSDFAKTIATSQGLKYHIPRFPLGQMVIWGTELRLGTSMKSLSPAGVVQQIAPRPVMFIHGEKDQGIPPEEAKALFSAAGEPKKLWLLPEADHADSFYRRKEEYTNQVLEFFRYGLRRET